MKECYRCGKTKPLSEFSVSRAVKKDFHSNWCKQCTKEYSDQYFKDNPDKLAERNAKREQSRIRRSKHE